jgi:Tfp pilus assembly pilus retraction ATPase PilT
MVQMNSIMQSAEKQGCILMEKTIQDFVKRGKIKTKDIPHGLIRHSIDSKFE